MKKLKYIASAILAFLVPTLAFAALSTVPLIRNSTTASEYLSYTADKLGIGTTSPDYTLTVQAPATQGVAFDRIGSGRIGVFNWASNDFNIIPNNNFRVGTLGSAAFNVLTNGNVGIGTTSPNAALAIQSSSNGGDLSIDNTSSRGPGLYFRKSGAFFGQIGSEGNWVPSTSQNLALAAGTGNAISFFTNNVSTARMYIDTTGNVGIGTTTPFAQLSVATPNGSTGALQTLFAIASSTQAGSTTTVFSVSPAGNTIINGTLNTGSLTMNGGAIITTSGAGISGNGFGLDQNAIGDITSKSTGRIGFVSSTNPTVAPDTAFSRLSAGVFGVGTGAQGNIGGTLIANTIGVGTSTPPTKFTVANEPLGLGANATTTVDFGDYATTTSQVCFNTKNNTGAAISFYFVGTTLTVENNRCK